MKLLSEGMWYLRSKTDSRWNHSEECSVGGFTMPKACEKYIELLTKLYGEPPEDLVWGYEKY